MGHGIKLEPRVEMSPWLGFKHTFNRQTFKVGLNPKSVLCRFGLLVLRGLFKLKCNEGVSQLTC